MGFFEGMRLMTAEMLSLDPSGKLTDVAMCFQVVVLAILSYYVARCLLQTVEKLVLRSPTEWDDDLVNRRFVNAVSQLAPAFCVSWALPSVFANYETLSSVTDTLTRLYILVMSVRVFTILIGNLYQAFQRREKLRAYAVKGFFQMLKLVIIGIGVIIGVSILIGKTPLAILTALGASAAVLMLVFKDTILGLVASIQLSANNMLKKGDWIVVQSHGANGEVTDISLTTIKVRNWDNTVTTIPPYSLVSESFDNYNAMVVSGGRRVNRAIFIDAESVADTDPALLESLREQGCVDADCRGGVNLSLFRDYVERMLRGNELVNQEMTLMVRELAPTPTGLPVELYFFTRTTSWVDYEHIQSDVFDRLYSDVRKFGLRIYQRPSGHDLRRV